MNKLYIDLPEYTRRAMVENLADIEIISVPNVAIPEKKIRIGALIDKVMRDSGASFEVSGVKFNINNHIASREGKRVKLTEKEVALVTYLHGHTDYISRQEILKEVWQYAQDADTRTIESHVHRLNQKFEDEFGFKLVGHKDNSYKIN